MTTQVRRGGSGLKYIGPKNAAGNPESTSLKSFKTIISGQEFESQPYDQGFTYSWHGTIGAKVEFVNVTQKVSENLDSYVLGQLQKYEKFKIHDRPLRSNDNKTAAQIDALMEQCNDIIVLIDDVDTALNMYANTPNYSLNTQALLLITEVRSSIDVINKSFNKAKNNQHQANTYTSASDYLKQYFNKLLIAKNLIESILGINSLTANDLRQAAYSLSVSDHLPILVDSENYPF